MTTDRRIEQLVADALRTAAPPDAPESLVPDVLRQAGRTRRRPRWIAVLAERPLVRAPVVLVGSPNARVASILVAAGLAALVGGLALFAVGLPARFSVLVPSTSLAPTSSAGPGPTTLLTPLPSEGAPEGGRLVAYVVSMQLKPEDCDRPFGLCTVSQLWISNTDGSDAQMLLAGEQGSGEVFGWSAEGARLLYRGSDGLVVADASGAAQQTFASDVTCPHQPKDQPIRLDYCTLQEGFSLSPDGTRVAFVRGYGNLDWMTVLAVLDLETGTVTELRATKATNGSEQCQTTQNCEGTNDTPRWSPDGRSLVFARQNMSPEAGSAWTSGAVYTIGADGRGLERVTPAGVFAVDPSWSPDGATITFINIEMIVNKNHTTVTDMLEDVYTIRPDGSEMQRLTDDGRSYGPRWTSTGQLAFVRGGWNWLMDAGGGNATRLDFDLGQLTAAGCVICRYPGPADQSGTAWWQPVPGG